MSRPVIRVEGLGKRYRIGQRERYLALRDVLANSLKAPLRLFQAARRSSNHQPQHIWALKDVSFGVNEGEVVGIIGRNGAGKTTLLKILARVTRPTEGYAEIRDRMGSLLEVGTGFHPELTGRENTYLSGAILGMKKKEIDRKFDEIVAFAEIEKFIDTPVKHYSSGMYVRLAFAVAAHLEPEILLVDEVLAVGDAAFQKKCLGKMGNAASQGRTIILVSHNMAAIKTLCKSAILLDAGRQIFEGGTEDVISRYLEESIREGRSGELPPKAHIVNTGEFWVHEVILTNRKRKPVAEVRIGEPFTIIVRFEIMQAVQWVRIGLGFNTHEGVRVASLHHTDEGQDFFGGEPGLYEISASLGNPFLPGTYIVGVGAHRALGGGTVDYVPEALKFRVLEISEKDDVHKEYNPGFIRLSASWTEPQRTGALDQLEKNS